MMPAGKCVTAMPEDTLSSVVHSLVTEKIPRRRRGPERPPRGYRHEAGRTDVLAQVRPATRAKRRARSARGTRRGRPAANTAGRTSAPPRGESHDFQRPSTRPRKKKGTNTARRFPPRPAPLTEDPSSASADVPDDAREERDEHDAPPRAARDDARRGGGDSPAAQDTPRRRADQGGEVRGPLLLLGHRPRCADARSTSETCAGSCTSDLILARERRRTIVSSNPDAFVGFEPSFFSRPHLSLPGRSRRSPVVGVSVQPRDVQRREDVLTRRGSGRRPNAGLAVQQKRVEQVRRRSRRVKTAQKTSAEIQTRRRKKRRLCYALSG